MAWTKSQQNVIDSEKKTLLVSAGAGSGKTSVLTTRLVEKVIGGASLDDFIVVTFTKSAAADLKNKLYERILAESSKAPSNKHLYNQLFILSGARISTINSFCLEIIRENYAALGISPSPLTLEEKDAAALKQECILEAIEELLSVEDACVRTLCERVFYGKKISALAKEVIKIYDKIRGYGDYIGWLDRIVCESHALAEQVGKKDYFEIQQGQEKAAWLRSDLLHVRRRCETLRETMSMVFGGCGAVVYLDNHIARISDLEKALSSHEAFCEECRRGLKLTNQMFSYPRGTAEEEKTSFTNEKKYIDKLLQAVVDQGTVTVAQLKEDAALSAEITSAFKTVLVKFDAIYAQAKRKKGVLDFADHEHMVYSLLAEKNEDGEDVPTSLCRELSLRCEELFIDEYQDVSPLQDKLFELLSCECRRFMVGDIKQSIYGFRNAYPEIFMSYRESFPMYDVQDEDDKAKVMLRENFRCDKPIIDFVNTVIEANTNTNIFTSEYEGESLIHGKTEGIERKIYPVQMIFAKYGKKSPFTDYTEAKQAEAAYIAEEISALCSGGGYRYEDVAVLFGAFAEGKTKLLEQELDRRGIPFHIERKQDFYAEQEISLIISLLKTVDNPTDDISLFAVLRSPLYHFTADEVYRLKKNSPMSLYEAMVSRKRIRRKPVNLNIRRVFSFMVSSSSHRKKLVCFLRDLRILRRKARSVPSHKFIWFVYGYFGLINLFNDSSASRRNENLMRFYRMAADFESSGYRGLYAFLELVTRESGEDAHGSSISYGVSEGSVQILTIHGSKGLEFPVCFVADCGRAFKDMDNAAPVAASFKYGLGAKLFLPDGKRNKSAVRAAIDRRAKEERTKESMRMLYVAMTRAKERLYVSASLAETAVYKTVDPQTPGGFYSWLLNAAMSGEKDCFQTIWLEGIPKEDGQSKKERTALTAEINTSYLEYRYPYMQTTRVLAKVNVSELSKGTDLLFGVDEVSAKPVFLRETVREGSSIGTANHTFMQYADFAAAQTDVRGEARRLVTEGIMEKELAELIEYDRVQEFFRSELYSTLKKAKQLYREKRFSVYTDSDILGTPGVKILLQGEIDVFAQMQDGEYIVVDYKSDRVKTARELYDRYAKQVRLYCLAVREMTGRVPTRACIYSFCLGEAAEVSVGEVFPAEGALL